jgi:hypothetical protein
MPPVSNVFHSLPQVQNHLSSFRGDQPQSGHRIGDPEESSLLSCLIWSSKSTDFAESLMALEDNVRV